MNKSIKLYQSLLHGNVVHEKLYVNNKLFFDDKFVPSNAWLELLGDEGYDVMCIQETKEES